MITYLLFLPMIFSFPIFITALVLYFLNVFIFRITPPLDNWTFIIASVIGFIATLIACVTGLWMYEAQRKYLEEKKEKKATDDSTSGQ